MLFIEIRLPNGCIIDCAVGLCNLIMQRTRFAAISRMNTFAKFGNNYEDTVILFQSKFGKLSTCYFVGFPLGLSLNLSFHRFGFQSSLRIPLGMGKIIIALARKNRAVIFKSWCCTSRRHQAHNKQCQNQNRTEPFCFHKSFSSRKLDDLTCKQVLSITIYRRAPPSHCG